MPRSNNSPLPRREGPGEGFPTVAPQIQFEAKSGQRSAVSSQPDKSIAKSAHLSATNSNEKPLTQPLPSGERGKATASRVARRLILAATLLATAGCNNHPPLERPSYDLAKALYATCNRQSPESLAKFDEVLAAAIAAGKVGPQEESALRKIAKVAAAGEWYDAQEMARALIASQNS
jgi:hypothetical protein